MLPRQRRGTKGDSGRPAWRLADGLDSPAHTNIRVMRRPPLRPDDGDKVTCPGLGGIWCPGRAEIHMGQTVRFQEILRRLAVMDEGVVQDQAGLGLGQGEPW